MKDEIFKRVYSYLENFSATIKEQKKTGGRKCIVVLPSYFPDEVVYAFGALPVRLWGSKRDPSRADALIQSFACTLSRTVLEEMLTNEDDVYDAFLFTSICDTFQNLYEVYRYTGKAKPSHMFLFPLTSSEEERKNYLNIQFQRKP